MRGSLPSLIYGGGPTYRNSSAAQWPLGNVLGPCQTRFLAVEVAWLAQRGLNESALTPLFRHRPQEPLDGERGELPTRAASVEVAGMRRPR